jgi:hypothetical protein
MDRKRQFFSCAAMMVVGMLSGCGPQPPKIDAAAHAAETEASGLRISFSDITAKAGIDFTHYSGAKGKKYMPETVGGGIAFIDFDNDGKLDLLFINSTDWPNSPNPKPHYPALYHNNGDGSFTEVTAASGLKIDVYGMGAAIGDYDNDGWADIFLTCIGPNHLFHNNHNGTFTDVTAKAGVAGVPVDPGGLRFKWSSSATWCDYDKDGVPDLLVCQYVKWTPTTDVFCTSRGGQKAYCAPNNYEGVACTLYHGKGSGTFEDVTEKAGILPHVGKSLGVIVADLNGDGWPDIAITNDTAANFLFLNEKGTHFREVGTEFGFAYPVTGVPKAGMGIDMADYMNDGRMGLAIGNFSKECVTLFANDGTALMSDQAYPLGVAQPSLPFLTFGLFFFDADMDGRQDLLTANGHIDTYVHESDAMITYAERPLFYHNTGKGFSEIGQKAGPALQTQLVGRGCAWGDVDLDGYPDIAIVSNNGKGYLWHNDTPHNNGWIGLKLRGTKSTRDAWGAKVQVTAGALKQSFQIYGGGSFIGQRQIWPLIGLGSSQQADRIEIEWPSGEKTQLRSLASGHYYEIVEGQQTANAVKP